jgi:3-deoxy-D-manno-octulosonic-acid transferase
MYFLYSALSAAGIFLLAPYFLVRHFLNKGTRQKRYLQNLPERLALRFPRELVSSNHDAGGEAPKENAREHSGAIWLHAVSVGEVLAAVPLARLLAERYRAKRLVISTTTATGQALAQERMKFADAIFYFPLDWCGSVRRALRAVRPELVIIFETEIWPNFLRESQRAGVPVIFVNGRISKRSFTQFSRTLQLSAGLLRGFLRSVLNDATLYLMQSEEDRARLVSLGARADRAVVAGNMKYDATMPTTMPRSTPLVDWLAAELARSRRRPVLVAGSVIAGEESAVLEALAVVSRLRPDALLIMAPRKPERFGAAATLIEQAGRRVVRRSGLSLSVDDSLGGTPNRMGDCGSEGVLARTPGQAGSVLLLDTIGELAALYAVADTVFIGGSLEPAGGHNPLEPATFGKVPVFGCSMDNFRDIAAAFLAADAAIEVRSGLDLGEVWSALLSDDARRERMGGAARELLQRHQGATAVTLEHIANLLGDPQVCR